MIFGPTALDEAVGAILAHTQRLPGRVVKKGTVLDAGAVSALREAGFRSVIAARLDPGDVPEDEAAHRLADALLGPALIRSRAATGRANLLAEAAGVLRVDVAGLNRLNGLDEGLTVATLADFAAVAPREMLATIKVIPFAVAGAVLTRAEALAREAPLLALHPYRRFVAGIVVSELAGMKESVLEGAEAVTRQRVEALGSTLLPAERCAHEEDAIAAALARLREAGAGMFLVAGASAVVDRRDVGPAGIVRAGGVIEHFGMPVDPGNLLCLGRLGEAPAMVLPGCARSPKLNGFDWVLQRMAAGLPVGGAEVMRMGAGGLLKEIESRPLPRAKAAALPRPVRAGRRVAAIVLAAGLSSRMAPANKLLQPGPGGAALVARVADQALASGAAPVLAVTGHDRARVEAVLEGRPLRTVHAPDYAEGMSASLRAGLDALPQDVEGVLVCLGDMPLVDAAVLRRLIEAFDPEEGRDIVRPTHKGRPGNPVLWGRAHWAEMRALRGDTGARAILARHADRTAEVEMPDDAVLRDFDTPEALAALGAPAAAS